jgi:hypothetical protein
MILKKRLKMQISNTIPELDILQEPAELTEIIKLQSEQMAWWKKLTLLS